MELRSLKEGSKTKVKLGACCVWPGTYSDWAIGEETAFLRQRAKRQDYGAVLDKGTTEDLSDISPVLE